MKSFLLLFITTSSLYAQISFTGNTETRIGESSSGFYYNETLVNTNLQFGAFTNWIQIEYSDPPELGRSINGVRKLRLEYDNGPIQLKLGDLYEIWGRGLVLNSVDDQSIDRDTGIRGLTLIYNNDLFSSQFIAGKADISQSTINALGFNNRRHNYQVSHNLYGLNIQKLFGDHDLGFSFLQGLEKHPVNTFPSDTIDIKNQFHSLNYNYMNSFFDFFVEYIMSRSYEFEEENWKSHVNGKGLYGNLNLYFNLFSLNLEYINYRYAKIDPVSRFNIVDYYGHSQPYQNPPVAVYIHENILMNRISHQTDFNNEVGYKAELIGSFSDNIDFLSIFSQSNRTHSWVMDESYMWNKDKEQSFLPSFNPAAMPFKEFYTELTLRTFQNNLFIKLGYADMKDIVDLLQNTVTDTSQSLTYSISNAKTVPLNLSYSFNNGWSIESKIELQWLKKGYWWYEEKNNQIIADSLMSIFLDEDGKRLKEEKNTFISFTISKSPKWSLTLTSDKTSVKESFIENNSIVNPLEKFLGIDQEKNWVNMEFVYHLTSSMRFSLLYGSLKGGLLCTNGVCRIIEPFDDGFKVGLSTVF